jgi:hypothetical protein
VGEEALFGGGCPVCGYSAAPKHGEKSPAAASSQKITAGALPFWVYILTGIVVLLVVIALFITAR